MLNRFGKCLPCWCYYCAACVMLILMMERGYKAVEDRAPAFRSLPFEEEIII